MKPSSILAFRELPQSEIKSPNSDPASYLTRSFEIAPGGQHAAPHPAGIDALFGFAEKLSSDEAVWLDLRWTMDAARTLVLKAGASLRVTPCDDGQAHTDGPFRDLRQALSLSFAGCDVLTSPELPDACRTQSAAWTTGFSIPLRGLPVLVSDLSGFADPELESVSPRDQNGPKHVVLGACASQGVLSDAARILRCADDPCTVRLTLRPRVLTSREIRELSALYKSLANLRGPQLLTSAEIARVADMSALVSNWLAAKTGVEMRVSVHSDIKPGNAQVSALSTAFSLPPSARRDTIQPALDLSGCFVRGQKRPDLTLDAELSRHLAPASGRTRRASDECSSVVVGVALNGAPVNLDDRSRSRHFLVCGSTGTGKSTLLKNMIASDIANGHGVILVDPHGDLFDDVLTILNRVPHVPAWIANTADTDAPYALNLFQSAGDSYRQNFVCNQLIRLLKRSLYKDVPQGFGPMFEAYFRNAFLLLADGGNGAFTLNDMDRVFGDARFRRELYDGCSNEHVLRFWRSIASKAGGEAALENIAPYIVSKLTQFVGNPVISPIVCSSVSSIDFSEVLGSGGVCIVNLAKGKVGATEAEILGGILTTALFSAALARSNRAERRPVHVYLDEFQSYAGEVISEMLAECRKYGLEMTLATQSLNRLRVMNGDLTQSVLGNVGNIIALRSGPQDADLLADWIGGGIHREDITSLDDFKAVGRFLENGRVTPPISFRLAETPERTVHPKRDRGSLCAKTAGEVPF